MYYQTYKQSWSVILHYKILDRQSEINVFNLRQLHKQYWKQCDIKQGGRVITLEDYKYDVFGKEWTFEDAQVRCFLANSFFQDYTECTDYWLFTYGPKIEQACAWYQKFKQQYPQFNTQLQYHEFSQSVMPHADHDFGNRDLKQCKMNYVALGNGEDYTLTPEGDQIAHVPGTAYLMKTELEHSAVVSEKTVFLTMMFHHPYDEVAGVIQQI